MTVQEMITKFENMVDDTLDADYALQLVMDAIFNAEESKDYEIRKKEKAYTVTAGQSYADTQALPTRFANDLFLVEDSDLRYRKILFEDRFQRVNSTNAYFLDMGNDAIGFAGLNLPAITLYLYYLDYSPDLAKTPDTSVSIIASTMRGTAYDKT